MSSQLIKKTYSQAQISRLRANATKRQQRYRERLTEQEKSEVKRKRKAYGLKNKETISIQRKARYLKRRAIELESGRQYKLKHKQAIKDKVKEYHTNHPELLAEINALRRAAKSNATPKWLTKQHRKDIREIYKQAKALGQTYHVDHIVPLQGKIVSGLHVPWNLQIITAAENIRKKNHYVIT